MKAIDILGSAAWFLLKVAALVVGLVCILSVTVIGVTGEGCVRLVGEGGTYFETRGCKVAP